MTRADILDDLFRVIDDRIRNPSPGSYVSRLVSGEKGRDRVLEKIGEESAEFIIAAKNSDPARVIAEAADLQFHLLVALRVHGVTFEDVCAELASRRR